MQPGPDQPTNVQDSVVGRDMHTGNVIHNHYHLPPTPQVVQPPPPQQVVVYQQPQQQLFIPYKKTHAFDWVVFGVISIIFSFIPSVGLCCGLMSGVGVISMLPHLHKAKDKQHPDSGKIIPAIVINSIAIFIALFATIVYLS